MEEKLQMIEYWDQMDYKNEEKKKKYHCIILD